MGRIDEFTRASLQSVANTTYSNYEVIIVCPPSIWDEVAKLSVAIFPDGNCTIIAEASKGLSAALNQAIDSASGEYIARMDADDLSLPNRLQVQVAILESKPDVAVVASQVNYICKHGTWLGASSYPKKTRRIRRRLVTKTNVAHPTTMFRKSEFIAVGWYSPFFRVCEDQDLWLRFLRIGSIECISEPLVKYRQHPGQISLAHSETIRLYSLIAVLVSTTTDHQRAQTTPDVYRKLEKFLADERYFETFQCLKGQLKILALLQVLLLLLNYRFIRKYEVLMTRREEKNTLVSRFIALAVTVAHSAVWFPFSVHHFALVGIDLFRQTIQPVRLCKFCQINQNA